MIVALMALADLCGLPSLLFTLLNLSIAADFKVVALQVSQADIGIPIDPYQKPIALSGVVSRKIASNKNQSGWDIRMN